MVGKARNAKYGTRNVLWQIVPVADVVVKESVYAIVDGAEIIVRYVSFKGLLN